MSNGGAYQIPKGRVPHEAWSAIWLTGTDRRAWLQGQITQDVRKLAEGNPIRFCLCRVTGQIESLGAIHAFPDRDLVLVPSEGAQAILGRVEQYVVLEDVQAIFADEPVHLVLGDGLSVGRGRAVELGDAPDLPIVPEPEAEFARLWNREPRWGLDISEKTLPPELGEAFESDHVSYEKGCFLGQEVLHRIFARGHTNWSWVILQADEMVPIGTPFVHPEWPEAGRITSVGNLKSAIILAARVRREIAAAEVSFSLGGVPARVLAIH